MVARNTRRPPGRPPDPPELRVLKGSRKGNAPTDTAKPGTVPPFPPTLREVGKQHWTLYWTYGAAWLAYTDIPTLTDLCQLHDEADAIRRTLDEEGWFAVSPNTGRSYTHKLVNELHSIRNRLLPLWIECHLTPSSRGRANVKAAAVDPLDAWAAQ